MTAGRQYKCGGPRMHLQRSAATGFLSAEQDGKTSSESFPQVERLVQAETPPPAFAAGKASVWNFSATKYQEN